MIASKKAKYLIKGCKAVIAGPPNTGKSTLLNTLAGKQKAIVTDIAGTTRDWISISCRIGNIPIEFFDTAGLDETLEKKDQVEQDSQKIARELIVNCDIVIYLSDTQQQTTEPKPDWLKNETVLFVQNKCDLLNDEQKQGFSNRYISISAQTGDGIDDLCTKILEALNVQNLDLNTAVCFTKRQTDLIKSLTTAKDAKQAKTAITQLLKGHISV